jgi:CheY-like chemotaxis protein
VDEATSELREQKQAAEAAVSSRSRFLAAASHDLRQPIHALILLVEALKEKLRTTSCGECLRLSEHIETSAQSMQSLLNGLLDISRLDAGAVVARPECFALGEVFERVARQFAPMAAEKGIELHVHQTRLTLFSDPALLERILGNLLANAIRYTVHGRVVLGVRRVQKDWVRIEVRDTGKGVPSSFRDKIFEEYFQLENPERDRDKGLGLGLAIVQRLAHLLGSPVEVQSSLGKGSCFSIRMVRCELPQGQARAEVEYVEGVPVTGTVAPLVAFIDDDEAILEAMTAMFEQWGMDLAVGGNANEVILDLHELGRKPDVVLSDYRLRDGRTGLDAIKEIRAVFGPDIPAILITGDTASTTIQAITQSGLYVLHKPVRPAALRSYLNHLLARRSAE